MSSTRAPREVAVVDGARIPFTTANTTYSEYLSYDLARLAMKGLLARHELPKENIDGVILGTVVQEGNLICQQLCSCYLIYYT